jgi:hypothetical protein
VKQTAEKMVGRKEKGNEKEGRKMIDEKSRNVEGEKRGEKK